MTAAGRDPRRTMLAVMLGSAALVLLAAELWARSSVNERGREDADTGPARAANVIAFPKGVEETPSPIKGATSLLLIGNSHTYALPSPTKGGWLRQDTGATLIDEIARRTEARTASGAPSLFYRLSYPNMLPMEMLSRVAQLYQLGHRFDVVLLGVNWTNLARGAEMRAQVEALYRDPSFVKAMEADLDAVGAAPDVREVVREAKRRAEHSLAEERMLSEADRIDTQLTDLLGERMVLIGQNARLRAQVYRSFNYGLASVVFGQTQGMTNDVVERDLELNRHALSALFKLLHAHQARLVAYQCPERTDIPPLVDQRRRPEVMAGMSGELAQLSYLLLDAGHVVPDQDFGWERETPDRAHFTEPGHQLLAQFLVDGAFAHGVFPLIARDSTAAKDP